jgi:hypothetical protein
MKIKELIDVLKDYDLEKEIVVFAEGNVYPTLGVQNFEGEIEISCGWEKINSENI